MNTLQSCRQLATRHRRANLPMLVQYQNSVCHRLSGAEVAAATEAEGPRLFFC
jgi:hypothetical protein